ARRLLPLRVDRRALRRYTTLAPVALAGDGRTNRSKGRLMRSLLFVPGDSERKLAKALASGADALILDLEDSVVPANRPAARTLSAAFVREARARASSPLLYVRINPVDGTDWESDLEVVMPSKPEG